MRYGVVVAAALALGASTARAETPTGFYASARLAPAASFVAGKRVTVWCAKNAAAFAAEGDANVAEQGGFVHDIGGSAMYLAPKTCAFLTAWTLKKRVDPYDFAWYVLTLAHEATHLRGVRDESATDCAALRALPATIRRFFAPGTRSTVHELMSYAWDAHSRAPAEYTRLC